jgi:alpha-L-fucosidase
MFIHWGPVSLTGREIGWSRGAPTPVAEYDQLYTKFNPVKFKAEEWVAVAKAAGMKYMVLTTKHHDGFCLWDTKFTDYNIMNSPFKRDVVKELAAACKQQGIAFGAYYSVTDWYHPGWPTTSPGGKVKRETSDMDAYEKYLQNQIRELITNYGPLLTIWNDVPREFGQRGLRTIEMVRTLQPDITINNRTGAGGDYDTPEQKIGGFNLDRPWESCMTVSAHNHWAWGGVTDGVKPLAACLQMLIRGAGGGGNVLLNVGPTPEGDIAAEQAGRLKEMGDWLQQYGASIYATRGGPYKPSKNVACTRAGNTIYLHIMGWEEGALALPPLPAKVLKSSLLTGGQATIKATEAGLEITVPPEHRQAIDTIVVLELDRPAMEIAPIAVRVGTESLTTGKKATASVGYQGDKRYGAEKAVDDDGDSRWATPAGTRQSWLEVDLGQVFTFDRATIREFEPRIASFELQTKEGEEWKTFHKGTAVGTDFETRFTSVTARYVRLNILDARNGPSIFDFCLFPPKK